MKAVKIILGVLAAALVAEFIVAILLAVLLYEATPKSVLAHQTFIGRIPGFLSGIRILDRSTNVLYRGPKPPEPLPHYALAIDPADLQKIEESLPKELPSPWYGNVFLTEDAKQWVKGTFRAADQEYDVSVRVRGDIFNHWAYRKKSWRIKFQNDQLFRGIREMNLIIPEDRGWIAEPLAAYRAKDMGFVQPPMQFVTVSLNGSDPMVYTQIEQFGKEMLEKLGRPGDVNIYGAGGGTSYFQQWDDVFADVAYWQKYGSAVAPPHDSVEEMEALRLLGREGAHREPGFQDRVRQLFDVRMLTDWYALSLLSGSSHVRDHNLRFLYDVSRGRIEPIPWDVSLFWPRTFLSLPGNPFLNEVFRVPEWKLQAFRTVWKYVNDAKKVEADLSEAARLRAMVERAAYRDPVKLPSNRQVHAELEERMKQVLANIDFAKEELRRSEVLVNQRLSSVGETQRGLLYTIDATTRGVSPALFAEISVPPSWKADVEQGRVVLLRDDGNFLWDAADRPIPLTLRATPDKAGRPVFQTKDELLSLVWAGDATYDAWEEVVQAPHTRHRFYLARKAGNAQFAEDDLPMNLEFRNAVTGEKAQVIGDVLLDGRTFERLSDATLDRATFLARNPAFRAEGTNGVLLQGSIVFDRTVIVPLGLRLRIMPGATVRMGKNVTLLSYSPVAVVGTQASPIRFEPKGGDPWGVFLVLNAKEPSEVQWAEFRGGGEAFVNDTYATGMVAFHGSPVKIRHAVFREAMGDDALNTKYIPMDVADSLFEGNASDGYDADMPSSGMIERSTFRNNGGDGIDLSFAMVTIQNVTVDGSGDKCISVGERSKPMIRDVTLKGCAIGIASKDSSEAVVERAKFIGNKTALSAYIKKPIFGPPSLTVRASTFEGNSREKEALSGATITIEP